MVRIGQRVTIGNTMGFVGRFMGPNGDIKKGDVFYVQNFIHKGEECQHQIYIYSEESYERYLNSEIAIRVVRHLEECDKSGSRAPGVWIPYIITVEYQSLGGMTTDIKPIKRESRSW